MEISAKTIYLFYVLGSLSELLKIIIFVSVFLAAFTGIASIVTQAEQEYATATAFRKAFKISCISFLVSACLSVIVPNKEALIAMFSVPKVLNNETIASMPENVAKFIESYIKDGLEKKK